MAEFTRAILKEHQAMKTKLEELEKEVEAIKAKLVRIPIGGVTDGDVGNTELQG